MYWRPRSPKPDTSHFVSGATLPDEREYVTDPGLFWIVGDNGSLWTRHPETLQIFQRYPQGFIFSAADGCVDRAGRPAGVSSSRLGWYQEGLPHRDPESGPAIIEFDGHVSYWVEGEEVEPSSQTLERQGVLWVAPGLLMKPSLRYGFERMRLSFVAETTPDPWAL